MASAVGPVAAVGDMKFRGGRVRGSAGELKYYAGEVYDVLVMGVGHFALASLGAVAVRRLGRAAAGELAYYSARLVRDAVFAVAHAPRRVR